MSGTDETSETSETSETTLPPVAIVGGGGFGRALAAAAHRNGRDVILWSRSAHQDLPYTTTDKLEDIRAAELVFLAVPSPYVPATAKALGSVLDGSHLLVHVSRGLIGDDLQTLSQHLRRATPCRRIGALAGPLDAEALLEGRPTGAIVGTRFPEVATAVREAIGGSALRIYESRDIVGVEVAAAVVGLMALATGYARAHGASPATLSVFLTRGMAESVRIAKALGAKPETFRGLAGFGDLLAVVGGDDRPEVRLGEALASGIPLAEAGAQVHAHIEGVSIGARLVAYAVVMGIAAPMANTVSEVIAGTIKPADAIEALMTRRVSTE